MKILVLYFFPQKQERKTVEDHLYSFKRYVPGVTFHYCNVLYRIPYYLQWCQYDGVILHYSLLSVKWSEDYWPLYSKTLLPTLQRFKGIKIAMPQDEYVHSGALCRFFKAAGIDVIYTLCPQEAHDVLYPREKTGVGEIVKTHPGFVDEKTAKINTNGDRPIAIGYRARKLPYWLGSHAQLKNTLAEQFQSVSSRYPNVKMDISTRDEDVFLGDEWFQFLLRCRTMLGCLGGASLHDPEGHLKKAVDSYVEQNPRASFEEVEQACFLGKDGNLPYNCLGPRHFECTMAKTCQILVEGDYFGVFQPDLHYIPLKRDFSNIDEVIEKAQDEELCRTIAERAYRDIVVSGNYTYRTFAQGVIDKILEKRKAQASYFQRFSFPLASVVLAIRHCLEPLYQKGFQRGLHYRMAIHRRLKK